MERRLAACLHADVTGYCRLIAADVESTVRTLTAYRAVMSRVVAKHGGRVVDTAGDSFLAEFGSVTGAVRCAVYIQRELEAHNAPLPASRRLEFRVGIDLGHVIVEGGRIYGDCVNIAARVQQDAPPGSICVAGAAYDDIDDALPVRFEYLGEHVVKNIAKPQRVYRVG
jgi:class 3 adenylate cyclase